MCEVFQTRNRAPVFHRASHKVHSDGIDRKHPNCKDVEHQEHLVDANAPYLVENIVKVHCGDSGIGAAATAAGGEGGDTIVNNAVAPVGVGVAVIVWVGYVDAASTVANVAICSRDYILVRCGAIVSEVVYEV